MRKIAFIGLAAMSIVFGAAIPAGAAISPAARPAAAGVPAADTTTPSLAGSRVSCGSANSCLAISQNVNSAGNTTPTADAWNGTAWRPLAVPLPKGAGGGLNGVSCKQASCLAVGYYSTTSGVYPLALTWNGGSLSPAAAPPMPAGAVDASLGDVSCVNAKSCVMIGSATRTGGASIVIDTWNGAKWTLHTAALPAGLAEAAFNGLSCVSASYCVAGGMSISKSLAIGPLLASWNGKAVTMMTVPVPKSAGFAEITDVSCVSATSCAATGITVLSLSTSATTSSGFADVLTGKAWQAAAIAWPAAGSSGLIGVSCTSPRSCVAVGGDGITNTNTANSGDAAAVSYNGKTWTVQNNVPGPGKGYASGFGGISCWSATDCVASGFTGKTTGTAAVPLNGVWNGKSWKLFRLP